MTCKCPSCGGAINYTQEDAGKIEACPHCATRLTLPSPTVLTATWQPARRRGPSKLVRLVGLAVLFASFVWLLLLVSTALRQGITAQSLSVAAFASLPAMLGMILGAGIIGLARNAGRRFVCSNCGNAVRRDAAVCGSCGAALA